MAVEIALPRPVVRDKKYVYDENTPIRIWTEKLMEEVFEWHEALISGDGVEAAKEAQDIIHVMTTFQDCMGLCLRDRQELCRNTNEKNEKRGYFTE